jgi:hypothetical protein
MGRGKSASATAVINRRAAPALAAVVTTKLYRSGELHKLNDFLEIVEINEAMDRYCPQGRATRSQGLFCTASIGSVSRWVAANLSCRYPYQPKEITYCGPEPYVYPIGLYERASSAYGSYRHLQGTEDPRWQQWEQMAQAYWEAGVPLSDFQDHEQDILEGDSWSEGYEILIAPETVKTHRPVSWSRLIAHTEDQSRLREFKDQQRKDARNRRFERARARA